MTAPRLGPVLMLIAPMAWADAILSADYRDGDDEGFFATSAPHPLSTDNGNPGTNLGEQRRWAFEQALAFWGARLDSGVTIQVNSRMNPMGCDANSALLGSAGTNSIHAGWTPGAGGQRGRASTWYSQSLANRIANRDISRATDMSVILNSRIDESDNCLMGTVWYYARGEAPHGTVSFFSAALHEIAHGLNVQTFVNLANGAKIYGLDDIYMTFLEDHSLGKTWPYLTNAERAASSVDTNDLHWVGPQVQLAINELGTGVLAGHAKMYAPSPRETGSSVLHWALDVSDTAGHDELMQPILNGMEKLLITDEMLHDMGWNDVPAGNCPYTEDRMTVSGPVYGHVVHKACISIRYAGAEVTAGSSVSAVGQHLSLGAGTRIAQGAVFTATMLGPQGL